MSKINFLTPDKPDFEQIRHQISGILDCYSHEWDLLSELSQNAIDAIALAGVKEGRIDVLVDAAAGRIQIEDNGAGIDREDIAKLLRPFGTNKVGRSNQLGQKGVGLKFVIFTSSRFKIATNNGSTASEAIIDDAAAWSRSSSETPLELELRDGSADQLTGTRVDIVLDNKNHPIFNYTFRDILFLLRTKTALGNADFIWGKALKARFTLTHIDRGGKKQADTLDCRYLLPTEKLPSTGVEDLEDFVKWLKVDRSDQEKRRRLVGKVITSRGTTPLSGRDVHYWSCYVPGRDTWSRLSSSFDLSNAQNEGAEISERLPGVGFESGFQAITKGMPTGITIPLVPKGQAGYLPNFFIVVDDPSLSFDIGRKYVHGRQQVSLKDIAYDSFNRYLSEIQKYLGSGVDIFENIANREEAFEQIALLPDLNTSGTSFVKRPNEQEATVAAIFFEHPNREILIHFGLYCWGYKRRYDLYARWKKHSVVIEFKYSLSGLFRDFSDETKMFHDINVAVIWEITEQDRKDAKETRSRTRAA